MTEPAGRELDSVMGPAGERLADAYAKALLGHLPSDREAAEVGDELDALVRLLDEVEGFEELLASALLSQKQRCELVQRVFHDRVSEPVEGLLGVMAEGGRLGLLRAVRRAFHSELHRRQGKPEVVVATAVALTDPQRRRITAALAAALGAEPVVTWQVEEDLLGGMVVRVGDELHDASVRSELRKIEQRLAAEIELPATAPSDEEAPQRDEMK